MVLSYAFNERTRMQEQSDLGPVDFERQPVRIIVCGSRDLGARLCIGFTNGRDPGTNKWGTGDMFSRALAAGIPVRGVPSVAQAVRGDQARRLSAKGRDR